MGGWTVAGFINMKTKLSHPVGFSLAGADAEVGNNPVQLAKFPLIQSQIRSSIFFSADANFMEGLKKMNSLHCQALSKGLKY